MLQTKPFKRVTKKGNKTLLHVTDVNHDSAVWRQKIKCSFLESSKKQLSAYIKDLEATVAINKQIIEKLLETSLGKESKQNVMALLNEENTKLQAQVQTLVKERDSFQSQFLISEQIIAELKGRENNYKGQMRERQVELLDQLGRKESLLQHLLRRLDRAVAVLGKYAGMDGEVRECVESLCHRSNVLSVVGQKTQLNAEMQDARLKMAELESRLRMLTRRGIGSMQDCLSKENADPLAPRSSSPLVLLEHKKLLAENKELKEQVEKLAKSNELLKSALSDMQLKNEELCRRINRSVELREPKLKEQEVKAVGGKEETSFDAISSIKEELVAEFLSNE